MMWALALMMAAPEPRIELPAEISRCAADRSVETLLCQALAAKGAERFADSAARFEEAAQLAPAGDGRRDRMWVAAGNMWIAAGEPAKAAQAIDKGLAGTGLDDHQRGEALIDRARAAEAAGDADTAMARLDAAARLVGEDPYLWFTKAAVALRLKDVPTAREAIGRGLALAPDSADLLLAAAEVESAAGDSAAARAYLEKASRAEPGSAAARNAGALLQLDGQDKPKEAHR